MGGWPVFLSNAVGVVVVAGGAYLAVSWLNRWTFRHVRRCDNPLHRVEAPAYAAVAQTETALFFLLLGVTGLVSSALYAWVWMAWPVPAGWVVLVLVLERRVRRWANGRRDELRSTS